MDGIVAALGFCDVVILPSIKRITAGRFGGPIWAKGIGQGEMDNVSETYLDGLERKMKALSYSRVPEIKPMGGINAEPSRAFIRFSIDRVKSYAQKPRLTLA